MYPLPILPTRYVDYHHLRTPASPLPHCRRDLFVSLFLDPPSIPVPAVLFYTLLIRDERRTMYTLYATAERSATSLATDAYLPWLRFQDVRETLFDSQGIESVTLEWTSYVKFEENRGIRCGGRRVSGMCLFMVRQMGLLRSLEISRHGAMYLHTDIGNDSICREYCTFLFV